MSEMVERVMTAIVATIIAKSGIGNDGSVARAAIEAMRDPTDAMCDKGDIWADGPGYSEKVWQAMIDVALDKVDA